MVQRSVWAIFLAFTAVRNVSAAGFFNLEELETSHYSVEIVDEPLSLVQEERAEEEQNLDLENIYVHSKVGQQYKCSYRAKPLKQAAPVEEEDPAAIDIPQLLTPMKQKCLTQTKDWWSYKFCFGADITQFHLNRNQVEGDIISLGVYESDQKWGQEDLEKVKRSSINKYHTQQYVNGSLCDLTGKPRKAEVRFSCLEGEPDQIGGIAELETCSYIVFIHTSSICNHPYLRPPVKAKPSPIQCRPLVSQEVYEQHLIDKMREEKRRREQKENPEAIPLRSLTDLLGADDQQNVLDQLNSLLDTSGYTLDLDDLDVEYMDLDDEETRDTVARVLGILPDEQDEEKANLDSESSPEGDSAEGDTRANLQQKLEAMLSKGDDALKKIKDELASKEGMNTMGDLKETMKTTIQKQLEELLDEDEEYGEPTRSAEMKKFLKEYMEDRLDVMKKYDDMQLDQQQLTDTFASLMETTKATRKAILDQMARVEVSGKTKAEVMAERQAKLSKATASIKEEIESASADNLFDEKKEKRKKKLNTPILKLELEAPKYEVEMIDADSLQGYKVDDAEGDEEDTRKKMIAVIKPMHRGSRREESAHSTLTNGYNKQWGDKKQKKDEL